MRGRAQAEAVARWPNRVEVLGNVVGLIVGPAGRLISQIAGPGCGIMGVIQALIERLEGEAAAGEPAAEA